jgi:hypothetical protein
MLRTVAVLLAVAAPLMPAAGQMTEPPNVPLWAKADNGDAIQRDLGFILPAKWRSFERKQFTSTRPDGGSTKIWYVDAGRNMRMNLLIQLRVDVRGLRLPPDQIRQLLMLSADAEYRGTTTGPAIPLEDGAFAARDGAEGYRRISRYPMASGPEVQSAWTWNLGMWAVVLTVSGPEARRAEIDAEAKAVLDEMPFPRAPRTAELLTLTDAELDAMPACAPVKTGDAREVEVETVWGTIMGIALTSYMVGDAKTAPPTPITHRDSYCRVERFERNGRRVVALAAPTLTSDAWDVRYGFLVDRGELGYYQVERSKMVAETLAAEKVAGGAELTQLNRGDPRKVQTLAIYNGWPSYAQARAAVERAIDGKTAAIVNVSMPPKQTVVGVNPDRTKKSAD